MPSKQRSEKNRATEGVELYGGPHDGEIRNIECGAVELLVRRRSGAFGIYSREGRRGSRRLFWQGYLHDAGWRQ